MPADQGVDVQIVDVQDRWCPGSSVIGGPVRLVVQGAIREK